MNAIALATPKDTFEFLPAALEIQATPPSPMGRVTLWVIIAFFGLAVVWACIGQVDIVAAASGKIIPSGHVKVIQPLELGVIRTIHVREGQPVAAGEVLIELDPTTTDADVARIDNERASAVLERDRLQSLVERLDERAGNDGARPAGAGPAAQTATVNADAGVERTLQDEILTSQLREHEARLASLEQQIAQRDAELAAVQATVAKLERTLPLVEQRAAALNELSERKLAATLEYLELEQTRIEQRHDLEAERNRITLTEAALAGAKEQRAALDAEFRRARLLELAEVGRKVDALDKELVKARQRTQLQQLKAPVAGVVQQLAVHTPGGVVTPAQELLHIVPDSASLEVEAWLANKDVGFVREGHAAEVKVETFPFTKYGVIEAKVLDVSNDAVSNEDLGLVYAARVQMEASTMTVEDRVVNLTPGMAVTVEVKTGTRRLIEFLMSPLLRGVQESARER